MYLDQFLHEARLDHASEQLGTQIFVRPSKIMEIMEILWKIMEFP